MTQPSDKWDEISRRIFATPVPDDLPIAYMRQWTLDNFANALRSAFAEGERTHDDVLSAAESWIDRWTTHVGNCKGGNECTCGRTAILFELRAAKDATSVAKETKE